MEINRYPWHGVIVAGGSGRRFGGGIPKQFLPLGRKTVFEWSLQVFISISNLRSMTIVVHSDWLPDVERLTEKYPMPNFHYQIVPGGEYRQDSSRSGVEAVRGDPHDLVCIHDAARPFIQPSLVNRILETAHAVGSAIPVIPIHDSVVSVQNGIVMDYPDRSSLVRVQTPQAFRLHIIKEAHQAAQSAGIHNAVDDGILVMGAGYPVASVAGDPNAIKITSPEDFVILKHLIGE